MAKNITVDAEKFDAILRRMLTMKPMSAKQLSVKLKAEKAKTKNGATRRSAPGTK
jgi:hypothetical protein